MSPGKTIPATPKQVGSKIVFHLIPLEKLQDEHSPSSRPHLIRQHVSDRDPDSITAKMSEDPCAHYRSTPFPSTASES
ncbi:hypothetical protein DFQ27_004615 [Actinomortierella ambigua]|uniref:Uncharacterized protein n=1 Tax=Actinomortierella ambigua TaxID=1343610 RepID=A0A9P6U365_9FUNG|nr:hypothetical protein DFQ27_004615 [Actinomortierella ambigua]